MIRSFMEFVGTTERSTCGYCKGTRSSCREGTSEEPPNAAIESSVTSGGAVAHKLRPADYGELLDMGWRRSGTYIYKPDNRETCCPQYTIRLNVDKFQMSRSQKRVMRQMNEFLATGKRPACGVKEEVAVEEKVEEAPSAQEKSEVAPAKPKTEKDADRPVKKKKEIRNKKFEEKCRRLNLNPNTVRTERRKKEEARRRTIKSYIDEARPDWKHKLEVQLVSLEAPEFEQRFEESFELYKKYQETVHNDVCRRASFRRFLCTSPLIRGYLDTGFAWEELEIRNHVGAYHLRFILDGKIIAVCVIDVLQYCVSAKYMFYDPDYSFLSMGTYTALREIQLTKQFRAINPPVMYYYMGYYIHSCPKMRYKAKFRPSDLLCDKSLKWLPFDKCKPLLDASTAPNGFVEFRPECEKERPIGWTDLTVYVKGNIYGMAELLDDYPVLEDEDFVSKLRKLASLLGPRLNEVVFYFHELNVDEE